MADYPMLGRSLLMLIKVKHSRAGGPLDAEKLYTHLPFRPGLYSACGSGGRQGGWHPTCLPAPSSPSASQISQCLLSALAQLPGDSTRCSWAARCSLMKYSCSRSAS